MIRKGQRITCQDGHVVGAASVDIDSWDAAKPENFELYGIARTEQGFPNKCPTCGASWVLSQAERIELPSVDDEGNVNPSKQGPVLSRPIGVRLFVLDGFDHIPVEFFAPDHPTLSESLEQAKAMLAEVLGPAGPKL